MMMMYRVRAPIYEDLVDIPTYLHTKDICFYGYCSVTWMASLTNAGRALVRLS